MQRVYQIIPKIECLVLTKLVSLALFLSLATTAGSQEVAEIPFFDAPEGTVGLGGGIRGGQSPYLVTDNEDQRQLDLIPLYLYEGKYLFFRGTAGGVHLVKNDTFEVNFLAKYRFQKLDPESNEFYQGLEKRNQTFDAEFQASMTKDWGELKLYWITDTLNNHKGQEVQFAYRYHFEAGPWSISPYASWTWQDANLTNFYFGVSEAEALPDRPAQRASSRFPAVAINTNSHELQITCSSS